ncbi:sigma-54-dependent Fis family transcriptional regulator [Algoriphagus halophilus]|uniref:PAS domain-containing protein n=1 Tax=Algoriphagus halophilus TaxID=226505 RepID=A0A1N6DGN7_9BACT|nr:sigma 54-interacting transcriptional regulator [Algoriphagus halophilus]SIN69887.1 PAS domain-containing protein [Algoriphagus halophilus]
MQPQKSTPSIIALKQIVESTSQFTGKEFFEALVKHLAEILDVYGVWVTEYWEDQNKLNALAFWLDGAYVDKYEYSVPNTPCEPVLNGHDICHIPNKVIDLYPKDPDLKPLGAVSYMGISLRDIDGKILGHLALLDNKPMPEIPEVFAIFKIFASRAAAELRRELIQKKVIESESKLYRLVNGTTDAIIEFNSEFKITQANDAANQLFEFKDLVFLGIDVKNLFDAHSSKTFELSILNYNNLCDTNGSLNFEEPFVCLNCKGESFPTKINLSSYLFENNLYYALFIRNIKDEVSSNMKIKELHAETAMLKEKVNAQQFNYIIGDSEPIKKCLEQVIQVARTNANVLILGETGTGKELFAKAVHESSDRSSKPMITLNCAALPAELIESELFGHVKGAFTGALTAREGRFSLADQGSIFLDEIAELPLPLQAKLLRVIQEGTFEPVGSSETKKVDVRIIAATHRNLQKQIEEGKFREDLFYRLNVFPINIPPLRERGDDITLIANAFFEKFTKNKALYVMPLTKRDLNKLSLYHWPGNVRELQNIIERGVITSKDGNFNLDSILPNSENKTPENSKSPSILTNDDIIEIEKNNIINALNLTNWRISGEDGAAHLLNLPRTTLTSKIKKFGIKQVAIG